MNKLRFRSGQVELRRVRVDSATVIEAGDLVWLDTDDGKPASAFAWTTNLATTQGNFAAKFLGVAHQQSRAGDTDPISVDVSPHSVYEFDCAAAAYELGALLGPDEASSTLMNQQFETVASAAAAIARAAEFTSGSVSTLRVTLASAYSAGVGDRVRDGFGGASGAIRPLEELSQLIGRIVGQVGQLNQTPIALNVEPALQSLGQLSQAIQSVAAQLAALAVMPIGGGPVGPAGGGPPIRAFAEGGFVTGPAGRDVIPSLLSAGEFVLSRETTAVLGSEFLETLNGVGAQRTSRPRLQESIVRNQQTTNHFGGITIQVANVGGVNDIVRDLRLQGVQLRNRRG